MGSESNPRSVETFSPLQVELPLDVRAQRIVERLSHVYEFALQEFEALGSTEHLLDIGTYDGFALPKLLKIANKVTTIDIDPHIIRAASTRQDLQKAIKNNNLSFALMDATNLSFQKDSFSAITCVEVFGAGFEGEEEDYEKVFEGCARVLKPGGKMFFTIKSATNERILSHLSWNFPKGVAISRGVLKPMLEPNFDLEWYGHVSFPIKSSGGRTTIEMSFQTLDSSNPQITDFCFHPEVYVPRHESELEDRIPLYWIGVATRH